MLARGGLVSVAPITHSQPADDRFAVEIHRSTKDRLNLDAERSWVATDEVNLFRWPGTDLVSVGDGWSYGRLTGPEVKTINQHMLNNIRRGRFQQTTRHEQ